MASTPQSRKAKGRRLQKTVCSEIRDAFSDYIQHDDVDWRSMGASGEDIILSPLAQEYFPFSSECKNTERLNIWKTLEQAFANETDDRPGIAIFKRNYSDIYATLRLSDFLNVLRTLADQRHELETLANLRNNN